MVKMTFQKFDELQEAHRTMHNPNPEFYPSHMDIISGLSQDEKMFTRYLMFLDTTGTTETEEGKEGKKRIQEVLKTTLLLVDAK